MFWKKTFSNVTGKQQILMQTEKRHYTFHSRLDQREISIFIIGTLKKDDRRWRAKLDCFDHKISTFPFWTVDTQ